MNKNILLLSAAGYGLYWLSNQKTANASKTIKIISVDYQTGRIDYEAGGKKLMFNCFQSSTAGMTFENGWNLQITVEDARDGMPAKVNFYGFDGSTNDPYKHSNQVREVVVWPTQLLKL